MEQSPEGGEGVCVEIADAKALRQQRAGRFLELGSCQWLEQSEHGEQEAR